MTSMDYRIPRVTRGVGPRVRTRHGKSATGLDTHIRQKPKDSLVTPTKLHGSHRGMYQKQYQLLSPTSKDRSIAVHCHKDVIEERDNHYK